MARTPEEIEARISEIVTQIAGLGPALQGTIKKNRNRRVRKDGSVYVSPEHYTFVYRDTKGNERWKRISAVHLSSVRRMINAGNAYKRLAREHARLVTELAVASIGKKTPDAEASAPGVGEYRIRPADPGVRTPRPRGPSRRCRRC